MSHRFTREELYALVWSEPMSRLAKRLSVTDVGLAKACRRADIPVPGLGYWAKHRYGKKVRRPPLPQTRPGIPGVVTITPTSPLPPNVHAQIQKELSSERKIIVPETLSNHHPLVRTWLEAQRRQLKEAIRRGQQPPSSRLHLTKTERRRLRLLSTLLNELEKRGHKVVADSSTTRKVSVLIAGEKIEFSLHERYRQVVLKLNEKTTPYGPVQKLRPTGELVLRLEEYLDRGTRVTWRDTPTKRLEERLNRVIVGLLTAAAILRERRLKYEEEERRNRAAREERTRQEEARRQEEGRLAHLIQSVKAWRQAADIRAYVEAVRIVGATGRCDIDPTYLEHWASWALARADQMDPLASNDPFPRDHNQGEQAKSRIFARAIGLDAQAADS